MAATAAEAEVRIGADAGAAGVGVSVARADVEIGAGVERANDIVTPGKEAPGSPRTGSVQELAHYFLHVGFAHCSQRHKTKMFLSVAFRPNVSPYLLMFRCKKTEH